MSRDFDRGRLDAVWNSDITYLPTVREWLYLRAVRHDYSRRFQGWVVDDHLRTQLVETSLSRAVSLRGRDTIGVIFHADRLNPPGTPPHTSARLAEFTAPLQLTIKVGRTEVCWDNAQIESFWSTLKTE